MDDDEAFEEDLLSYDKNSLMTGSAFGGGSYEGVELEEPEEALATWGGRIIELGTYIPICYAISQLGLKLTFSLPIYLSSQVWMSMDKSRLSRQSVPSSSLLMQAKRKKKC